MLGVLIPATKTTSGSPTVTAGPSQFPLLFGARRTVTAAAVTMTASPASSGTMTPAA